MIKVFSPTCGEMTQEEVNKILIDKINNSGEEIELVIGTDSQAHSKLKFVTVIALRFVGHGGIFFYEFTYLDRIPSLREKIYFETQKSLELAQTISAEVLTKVTHPYKLSVHVDIGKYGKTKSMISEITGWVTSTGFECKIKPESYVASGIANKFSK